jgi:hypothetical protein
MTFAEASNHLFRGKSIQRRGWVEVVKYMPPRVSLDGPEPVNIAGYYILCLPGNQWFPGWVPSQADLMSSDWIVK